MELTLDGLIYQRQQKGGISRMFNEVLPRMCQADPDLKIRLVTTGQSAQALPHHPQIHPLRKFSLDDYLWPKRLWWPVEDSLRTLALRQVSNRSPTSVWHSTYYSIPDRWRGPAVVSVYDLIHEKFAHLFTGARWERTREQMKKAVLKADLLLCISETTAQDLAEIHGIPEDRIAVAPLSHSPVFSRIADPPTTTDEKPFLLTVGARFGHPAFQYKNAMLFLRAFSRWKRSNEFDLVCVSERWSSQEHAILSELGLAARTRLLESISDEELAGLYRNAAAFVYPSKYEGFGIPVLEALAARCPVVASRVPSSVEVGDDVPFYFGAEDDEEVMEAVDLAVNTGRQPGRIARGLDVVKRFSWDKTTHAILDAYGNVS